MANVRGKTKKFMKHVTNFDEYLLERVVTAKGKCICGTRIKYIFQYRHKTSNDLISLGSKCANRMGDPISWKTPADYLALAHRLAFFEKEREFVTSLIMKLTRYPNLIISHNQKIWLEDIVGLRWKWRVWKK